MAVVNRLGEALGDMAREWRRQSNEKMAKLIAEGVEPLEARRRVNYPNMSIESWKARCAENDRIFGVEDNE